MSTIHDANVIGGERRGDNLARKVALREVEGVRTEVAGSSGNATVIYKTGCPVRTTAGSISAASIYIFSRIVFSSLWRRRDFPQERGGEVERGETMVRTGG